MKYAVDIRLAGHQVVTVEAATEEEAIDLAVDKFLDHGGTVDLLSVEDVWEVVE